MRVTRRVRLLATLIAVGTIGCASAPAEEGSAETSQSDVQGEPPPDADEHEPLPSGPPVKLSDDVPSEDEGEETNGSPVRAQRITGRRKSARSGESAAASPDGRGGGGESSGAGAAPGRSVPGGAEAVSRDRIRELVDRGPAYVLQAVRLEPARRDGEFRGFEIVAASGAAEKVMEPQLQVGDVVHRINDRRIKRPDDYLKVWKKLPELSKVVVHYRRDGSNRRAVWIVRE